MPNAKSQRDLQQAIPALSAMAFAFVVFLFSYASHPLAFFVGLLVFACATSALHFSYSHR